ncbi:hypothetical protein DFH08DRAFT_420224 [Mycena albidolilacea]|uniref:Uncharacterized protein n=1 Tax=Mycena albidolilacea TaxID=1033008 RepID=A0AAD6ZC16_9AGAR|nr:hypothetical protein DFH08DRAFT_420224 [Mycena albidolilacea]
MSAKSRAIGDTENEFQAALATYTKAGNKTAAMRRLWNAAYEIGKMAAEAAALRVEEERLEATRRKESNRVEEERIRAFTRGKAAGFEAGRDAALTADALEVSFASGKIAGRADGVEIGRETEGKRWRDAGHSEDGTCRKLDELYIAASTPSPFPTHVPGVFDWADDAESLPIHTVIRESDVRQPRDFSALRLSATNPFQTLQRRHARYHGNHTRSRRTRQPPLYSISSYNDPRFISPPSTRPARLTLTTPRSKPGLSFLGLLVWLWTTWYLPLRRQVSLG